MKRVKNAEDFKKEIALCLSKRVGILDFAGAEPDRSDPGKRLKWLEVREWLECHAREFFIDHLLDKLNWHSEASESVGEYKERNLVKEAGLTSVQKDTRRFLDYFGYDHESGRPLLIVEAKRPSLSLPVMSPDDGISPQRHPAVEPIARYLSSQVPAGDTETATVVVGGKWAEYLDDLRDYVLSTIRTGTEAPKRVVLTTGQWLIVFTDPASIFGNRHQHIDDTIYVFQNTNSIIQYADVIFDLLEYYSLSEAALEVEPPQLPFLVRSDDIRSLMYGLRVLHTQDVKMEFALVPRISVQPVIIVQSHRCSYLMATRKHDSLDVPTRDVESLGSHLGEVEDRAKMLSKEVCDAIGIDDSHFQTLDKHYSNRAAFGILPGVRLARTHDSHTAHEYVVVTGEHTHLLLNRDTYDDCEFHQHSRATELRRAKETLPILQPSIDHRTIHVDTERHHCMHRDVHSMKSEAVTPANRGLCGSRSGQTYCEIWPFESFLCCRTCAFEGVCTSRQLFRLPCEPQTIALTISASRT